MPYPYYGNPYYPAPMQDNLMQMRQQYQLPQPVSGPAPEPGPELVQTQQLPTAQNGSVIWVQGEEGAKSYLVAAGNTVLLMDSESDTFYLKEVDKHKKPKPLRIFDYTERTPTLKTPQAATAAQPGDYVTRGEFERLAARIDAMTAKEGENA